jgi:hypothetical protein
MPFFTRHRKLVCIILQAAAFNKFQTSHNLTTPGTTILLYRSYALTRATSRRNLLKRQNIIKMENLSAIRHCKTDMASIPTTKEVVLFIKKWQYPSVQSTQSTHTQTKVNFISQALYCQTVYKSIFLRKPICCVYRLSDFFYFYM